MLMRMASSKVKMINVRLTSEMHKAFKIACELRGASMSSFLHQTIARTIREEKEREPRAFTLKAETGGYAVVGANLKVTHGKAETEVIRVPKGSANQEAAKRNAKKTPKSKKA